MIRDHKYTGCSLDEGTLKDITFGKISGNIFHPLEPYVRTKALDFLKGTVVYKNDHVVGYVRIGFDYRVKNVFKIFSPAAKNKMIFHTLKFFQPLIVFVPDRDDAFSYLSHDDSPECHSKKKKAKRCHASRNSLHVVVIIGRNNGNN